MHPVGPTLSGLAATKSLSPDAASGETDIFLMKVDSWCEISGLSRKPSGAHEKTGDRTSGPVFPALPRKPAHPVRLRLGGGRPDATFCLNRPGR